MTMLLNGYSVRNPSFDSSTGDVKTEEIQEAGEDLATELGRVREAKIGMRQIINRLQR